MTALSPPSRFSHFIERMYGPERWARDPCVQEAKSAMESVVLPSCGADVFNKEAIACMKALFHSQVFQDPTPGFGFGRMCSYYAKTLEAYWVDKHLSTAQNVPTSIVEEVLQRIERVIDKQLHGTPNEKRLPFAREFFYDVEYSEEGRGKPFLIPSYFLIRVVRRLLRVLTPQICQAIPPSFTEPHLLKRLEEDLQDGTISIPDLENERDFASYRAYAKEIFDERDRRMLVILKEAFTKDKEARQSDPNAPLTHLVTLEGYESAIKEKKRVLHQKEQRIFYATYAIFVFFFIIAWSTIAHLVVASAEKGRGIYQDLV